MGRVATEALHCVIEGGIEVDSSLTSHYTLHFSMIGRFPETPPVHYFHGGRVPRSH